MSPSGNGEAGNTEQHIAQNLQQNVDRVRHSPPRSRAGLDQIIQNQKDAAAKLAQGQTETPNPNAPQAEKPLNRGTPAQVAAKDALLNLPPEERLMQNKDQATSDLERQRDAAAQDNDVEEFRRLNNVIRRLKTPSSQE